MRQQCKVERWARTSRCLACSITENRMCDPNYLCMRDSVSSKASRDFTRLSTAEFAPSNTHISGKSERAFITPYCNDRRYIAITVNLRVRRYARYPAPPASGCCSCWCRSCGEVVGDSACCSGGGICTVGMNSTHSSATYHVRDLVRGTTHLRGSRWPE